MLVQDDGQGFSADEAVGSIGLRGMRERARLIGGTLEVDSLAGWGTRVRVSARLDGAADATSRVRALVAAPHPITRAGVVRSARRRRAGAAGGR